MRRGVFACLLILAGCAAPQAREEEAIRGVLAKYLKAVDAADTVLAREVWADSPDISFIHPMGHERGWAQVSGFYEKIMGGMFSSRKLAAKDVVVKVWGDTAQMEFYWVFDAKLRQNGAAIRTEGRESQMLRKIGGSWRVVHVHYSGMPATAPPAL